MAFKGLRFARAEVRNTTANNAIKVAMVAISVIPLLYGALYLFAFLDPYEQLNTVPVAVVNEDKGAQVNGEFRVVGDDVVERLRDNTDGLGWNFVTAADAQEGLENGNYYMTCTIPEDFTQAIASADSDSPETAQLVIDYNETKNMLASQVGGTVWKEVRQQVSDSVAEEYWETVFGKVNDGAADLQIAADGAEELKDGLQDAHEGSQIITDNLNTLHDGSVALSDGVSSLLDGETTLAKGTSDLSSGAVKLAQGSGELSSGAGTLASGATRLANGVHSLDSGVGTLSSGASELAAGTKSLFAGATTLYSGATQLKESGTAQLAAGTKELREKTAALPDENTVQAVQAGSSQISSGMAAIQSGLEQLKGSAEDGTGLAYAAAATHQLAQALGDTSAIDSGVAQLQAGVAQIQDGRSRADQGIVQVEGALSGAQQQVSGALQYLNAINLEALDSQSQGTLAAAITLLDASSGGANATLAAGGEGLAMVEEGLSESGAMDVGLQQIDGGLDQLKVQADSSLATASGAAEQIASGLDVAVASIGDSATQGTLLGGVSALQSGYENFSGQLMPLVEQAPTLKSAIEQIDDGASQIDTNMASVVTGSHELAEGASQVDGGASQLAAGTSTLVQGTASLSSGADSLDSGAATLSSGALEAYNGALSLASGTFQVNNGVANLVSGTKQLKSGSASLASGSEKLAEGSRELTSGLGDALDGSGELADGLDEGVGKLRVENTQAKAEVMSAPVQLKNEYFTTVKNYGTGFAPYFIALGLWVGALMGSFVFKPLNKRLILSGGNPGMVAFASYMPTALLGFVQVILLQLVLQFGLGLQIDNVPLYYAFGIFTALVFAAIMQMLMAAFGFPGKFISIILLMLQLTSAAGTFPIEQTPAFFQAVNPYLPMTYVVSGMRQIMTGSDMGVVATCVGVLLAFGLGSFLITTLTARRKRMVSMTDLHPVLNLG